MAAAKALLSASGLLKPNTKLLKNSTATELATSSSNSTATELATSSSQPDPAASTDGVSRLPLTGLQGFASEDGFLLGDNDLTKTVALLLWMAQDFQSNIHVDDIHCAALEVIIKHADAATGSALGSLRQEAHSVAKLSELIDIMMLHKDGSPKDANATLEFMRRVAKIREGTTSHIQRQCYRACRTGSSHIERQCYRACRIGSRRSVFVLSAVWSHLAQKRHLATPEARREVSPPKQLQGRHVPVKVSAILY